MVNIQLIHSEYRLSHNNHGKIEIRPTRQSIKQSIVDIIDHSFLFYSTTTTTSLMNNILSWKEIEILVISL